jgi:hypothetical protein
LELAKDQIIRSAIIQKYVLLDEFLSAVVCWHFFGKRRGFPELWRTKRFRSFNYFVLERLYLLQKLDLVRSVHEIPKWVTDLAALNDLRNGIAHSFFPQNRRRKPEWKGVSVFTMAGFEGFLKDISSSGISLSIALGGFTGVHRRSARHQRRRARTAWRITIGLSGSSTRSLRSLASSAQP